MRRQNKSTPVVAQPNLFHMWNMGSTNVKEREDIHATRFENIRESFGPVTGVEGSTPHATADGLSCSEQMGISESEGKTKGSSSACKSSSEEAMILGAAKEGLCSNSINVLTNYNSESEGIGDNVQGFQPSKLRARSVVGQNRRAENGSSHTKLFPIFGKEKGQHMNATAAEVTSSSDKTELLGSKLKKGKITTKSSRPQKVKPPANQRRRSPEPEIDADSSSAGPSTQTSLGSQDTICLTCDIKLSKLTSRLAGGSQDEPIVIDSSPLREMADYIILDSSPPAKMRQALRDDGSQDFFAPRKKPSSTSGKVRRKTREGIPAEWPAKDSQHVRGVQRSFPVVSLEPSRLRAKRQEKDLSNPIAESISYLRMDDVSQRAHEPKYLIHPVGSQQNGHARCEGILNSKATCPAISRFLSDDSNVSGSPWNEKWRPRCANEVIGNEASSLYLRDWLLALEIKADGHDPVLDTEHMPDMNTQSAGKVLQGTKRPQVIRTVDKPRKRQKKIDSDEESLDDWLTSDDDEDEGVALPLTCLRAREASSDEAELQSPWKPKITRLTRRRSPDHDGLDNRNDNSAPSIPQMVHDFSDRLTNTILLTGPTGSGKTAAVYACAEELGWEIFEVYPGIGKRNGASLLSLVGDVGKNHIVNRSRGTASTHEVPLDPSNLPRRSSVVSNGDRRNTFSKTFTSFFNREHKRPVEAAPNDIIESERTTVNSGDREPSHALDVASTRSSLDLPAPSSGRAPTPIEDIDRRRAIAHQSIILLEEVDILFNEDVSFWPTVVALIRESRRPVIMTCNDPSLVPSAGLPLQTVLSFEPCPLDLAISYLERMALKEGHVVSEEHVKAFYGSGQLLDVLDTCDCFLRSATYPPSPPDLRHAINSLQILCQGRHGSKQTNSSNGSDIAGPTMATGAAVDEAYAWDWTQHFGPDCLILPSEREEASGKRPRGATSLWCISDSLSMIDSYLGRRPLDTLQILSHATGAPTDNELGYTCLEYERDVSHLQGGIVPYNYDEAIATEAVACIGRAMGNEAFASGTDLIRDVRTGERWKQSFMELLRSSSGHFARVSGVLKEIVPSVVRQSVGALILDYEPWVRSIDRSDMEQEAATLKESEPRTGMRGGRATRNSQRRQYQRYFDLDEEERKDWHANGLTNNGEDGTGWKQ